MHTGTHVRRATRTVFHAEPGRRSIPPPALQCWQLLLSLFGSARPLFVNEGRANGASSAIQVLVRAPDGKVNVPLMQVQGHVADGVSQVRADGDAFGVSSLRQLGNVEQLSRVVLDSWHQEDGHALSFLTDLLQHVFLSNQAFTLCPCVRQ